MPKQREQPENEFVWMLLSGITQRIYKTDKPQHLVKKGMIQLGTTEAHF